MNRLAIHIAPDKTDVVNNVSHEPEGERIRAELIDFLTRNKIHSIMLDTDDHCVQVDGVKLPPRIKDVLTIWGSIYVRVEDVTENSK